MRNNTDQTPPAESSSLMREERAFKEIHFSKNHVHFYF